MSKNVISQSDELIRLRKHMRRTNVFFSILICLFVIIVWAVYVLLAALGKGYYHLSEPFGAVASLSKIPYPDMNTFLFTTSINSIYRMVIILCVVVIGVAAAIIFHVANYRAMNKTYKKKFLELLKEEGKINGLIFDVYQDNEKESFSDTLHLLNLDSPSFKGAMQFSTALLSTITRQYTYQRDGGVRDGLVVSTELTKARSHAFIELRTFGEPSIKQYEGLPIKKYGFGEISGLSNFVCFTTLGQDIYLTIDKKAANAISSLYNFLKCDMVIMVIGDKLTIFIDGFKLRLSRDLKVFIPNQILEQEAEALVALHQVVTNVSNAFSGDITYQKEEKGNGITSY